jgi:Spy/CpxP family protein refolding chaperone
MNNIYLKPARALLLMTLFYNSNLQADQIPDPGVAQKEAIDQMHHKLHDDQAAFKAAEARALKELNKITVREDVTVKQLNAKIEQLMAAKTQILRLRYGHLVEMRAILTDEQKVGYDKGVLNRSSVK